MSRLLISKVYWCCNPNSYLASSRTHKYVVRAFVTALPSRAKELSKHVRGDTSQSFGQKAKEATKTTYYAAIVIAGLGAFGLMMYAVFRELFASFSPQSVYSCAVDKVTAHPKVIDMLGDSIKSYGETSRRGRRQHVSHFPYEVEGVKGLRIKFYIQGQRRSGSVHLDARTTISGWEFRYLFLQLDSYPHQVIVVEDNRGRIEGSSDTAPSQGSRTTTEDSQPLFPSSIFGDTDEA